MLSKRLYEKLCGLTIHGRWRQRHHLFTISGGKLVRHLRAGALEADSPIVWGRIPMFLYEQGGADYRCFINPAVV